MSDPRETAGEHDGHLIHVEEEAVQIDFHIDDVIAFVLFWTLGGVTFLQFFSRYVMNDSIAWTEEIARYLLMWVTFFGAAIVFRRRSNIAVEFISESMPEGIARVLRCVIDCITVGFVALLVYFAYLVSIRMAIQRMTVIDVSMSVVYSGIGIGCVLMLWRALQVFIANARRGWRLDPAHSALIVD